MNRQCIVRTSSPEHSEWYNHVFIINKRGFLRNLHKSHTKTTNSIYDNAGVNISARNRVSRKTFTFRTKIRLWITHIRVLDHFNRFVRTLFVGILLLKFTQNDVHHLARGNSGNRAFAASYVSSFIFMYCESNTLDRMATPKSHWIYILNIGKN